MIALALELRRAARVLFKSRGFTAAAVLTLALGMTLAMTAMIVLKAYLASGLPYPAADRLYSIRFSTSDVNGLRGLEKLDWNSLNDVVEYPIAWDLDVFYMLGGDHAESFPGAWVTSGFVEGLGIQPAIGRVFDRQAFSPGAPNVALISHRIWTDRYGRDPAIIGRSFSAYVSDRPQEAEHFTIVGVLPQGFWHFNPYTEILVPLRAPTYPYMARLRPGVSPASVEERVRALVASPPRTAPPGFNVTLVSVREAYVQQVRPVLRMTAGAATLVLLVACANVAGLLLVRAARRHRELAIRTALGAGSAAIARMLLAEAIVIGAAASVLALIGSWAAVQWLQPIVQQQLGRPAPGGAQAFAIDGWVLAGAMTAGKVTSIGCALVPLVASLRRPLLDALQSGSRTATEGLRSQRARAVLIVVEVAASLTLLSGSALMIRSVMTLLHVDLGFTAERVLLASVTLRQNRYPDGPSRLAALDRMLAGLKSLPGVEAVGLTTVWPVQQPRLVPIETAGGDSRVGANAPIHTVSDTYFETVGIAIRSGRSFSPSDRPGSEPVAIVSESLARRLWPAGDATGSRVSIPDMREESSSPDQRPASVQRLIVGIARDVRQDPSDTELADVYVPVSQAPTRFANLLVRTSGPPAASLDAIRAALHEVDQELAVDRARPLQAIVAGITARPKFLGSLLSAFAVVAAALALVGVYGVIAYAVRQREREIAVRLAVGATPSAVTHMFVWQGSWIIAAGLVIGVATTLVAGRLIESQLYAVTPRDPVTLAIAAGAFAAAGLIAVWWPARRAATTDPAIALKSE